MREIEAILQSCWSSLNHGVDIVRASKALYIKHMEEMGKQAERLSTEYTKQLLEQEKTMESFEEDMEASNELLVVILPELNAYKCTQSNNQRKYAELSELIYKIEEQIKKNEQ